MLFKLLNRTKKQKDVVRTLGDIQVEIRRSSKRKSVSISVCNGCAIVRAPCVMPEDLIWSWVESKEAWLHSKLFQQQRWHDKAAQFQFMPGDLCLYLGAEYPLTIKVASKRYVEFDDTGWVFFLPESQLVKYQHLPIKPLVAAWFKKQASLYLPNRVNKISAEIGLEPSCLTIRSFKSRWGSCNSHGEIKLNYWLLMAPPFVIDYVIIHELCHLKHLNHSKAFWALVSQHCPDMAPAKSWLAENSYKLSI